MDAEESLLHGTTTVVFIRYGGVIADGPFFSMCFD
jgi:hypothetical protein